MIKLKYRTGLKDMPSYDVVERDWDIKVNANESNMNLPPIIEDRLMARLASVAFNRYPNEQVELLAEQVELINQNISAEAEGNAARNLNIQGRFLKNRFDNTGNDLGLGEAISQNIEKNEKPRMNQELEREHDEITKNVETKEDNVIDVLGDLNQSSVKKMKI